MSELWDFIFIYKMHVCSSVIEMIYIFENMVSAKELAQTAAYKKNITAQKNRGRRDLHIGILVHGTLNDLIFRNTTTQDLVEKKSVHDGH